MTFIYYVLLVIIQWILLGKKFDYFQFLQIPASLVTSFFIQLFDGVIPVASRFPARIVMLILAIAITGIGASLTVGMKIVPNPADGLASVIGEKCHKGFGFGKNLFDGISIVISLIIGFVFTGGILGIGLGTVISMIFTGRVIALLETSISKLYSSVTERNLLNKEDFIGKYAHLCIFAFLYAGHGIYLGGESPLWGRCRNCNH